MTRAVRSNPPASIAPPDVSLLDYLLFYVLLALLCVRPLISETFEPLQVSFLVALQAEAGPTPATTAWLDGLTLAASALALARGVPGRHGRAVVLGVLLLAAAVVLSSLAAGDKPIALLAGASLVIAVLAGAALAGLVRTRWMLGLLLGALLATGITTAVKCLSQRWYENPLTQQRWETVYRPELLRQGFDPQDPLFINFERRMRAGESYGFLGHPNLTASCLMMWLAIAAGVAVGRVVESLPRHERNSKVETPTTAGRPWTSCVVGVLLCVLLAGALCTTGSRGALVAGAGAVLMLAVLGRAARWCARHARMVLTLLVASYLAFSAGGIAYGLKKGTLPQASLAFRWDYWTAAWRAWQDAPLTGLGCENFGPAYVQYKRPQSPEEVRSPHNLWLGLLVELGPLGLAAGVLLCGACVLSALRGLAPVGATTSPDGAVTAGRAAPLAIGVLLAHAWFSATPFREPGALLVWGQEIAVPWVLALAATSWLSVRGIAGSQLRVWLVGGLCAAMLGALVHGLVDFALLTPAGLSVFTLVGAAAAGSSASPGERTEQRRRWSPLMVGVGVVLLAAHALTVVRPATRSARVLASLQEALARPPSADRPKAVLEAVDSYTARYCGDAVSRTALHDLLQLARSPEIAPDQRLDWLMLVRARAAATCVANSRETGNYILLATADEELARHYAQTGDADSAAQYRRSAAEDWDQAVQRYPTNPHTRISAGKAWLETWRYQRAPDAAERARAHFQAALRIDDSRPAEEVVRLRPRERAEIVSELRALDEFTPPATEPLSR